MLEDNHKVKVLDINAHRFRKEEVEEKIKNSKAEVFGIGGLITTYKYVKWLCEIIKKYHPDKKIIVGGSVATSIPKILLKNTKADIVVKGEGELTAPDLIKTLKQGKNLKNVKGIIFKHKNGKIFKNPPREPIKDLDTIPFPAWDLFPMNIYLKNPIGIINKNKWNDGSATNQDIPLSINISGTRGCPYQCIYCYHDFLGYGYRHRSPENIIKEFKILKKRYRVGYIHFVDDEFCLKKSFVEDFCRRLIKENLGIKWGCAGRVNLADEKLYQLMKKAGCINICYGIESGSQKMLDIMKKGVTVEQAKKALKMTKKIFGENDVSFMVGMLGETEETIKETIDFCKETGLKPEVVFFVTPYPGTELYKIVKQKGLIKDEVAYIESLGEQGEQIVVNLTDFSNKKLKELKEKVVITLDAWNKKTHGNVNEVK